MHIMVDLETMGTRPDAPIISIGAVKFDTRGIESEFYRNVDLQTSIDGGAVLDARTVQWWMQQSDEARAALTGEAESLSVVLYQFREWMKPHNIDGVWGNGASFDNVILTEAYRRLNMEPPWPFYIDRCYRTVKNLYPAVKIDRKGTHHNALDDAKSQAEHLLRINTNAGGFL